MKIWLVEPGELRNRRRVAKNLAESYTDQPIFETLAGGSAFIEEIDGYKVAVIIQIQDQDGPVMTYGGGE